MSDTQTETYTKAEFWKCALQVNPWNYIQYRGTEHGLPEDEYNRQLVRIALENHIKVIGYADHGCVDGLDALRTVMNEQGIIVFPGFEIASTEKVHFVCLFSEETSCKELHRIMGKLDLLNPENGVCPSKLGGNELIRLVTTELNGFIYAAHCTEDSGLLKEKKGHVWTDPNLRAAQIPGSLEDLKNAEGNTYRLILQNKQPEYRRDRPVAIINAKDVAKPEDLADPRASCLIRMTRPSFDAFKASFSDPESRIRLNSERTEKYYSAIEKMTITGGYLDGLSVDFSRHLNTVIGGRGTGKSTLLECIRFAFDLIPLGTNAQKNYREIIGENIGKVKARVELTVVSAALNGKRFIISRREGESPVVRDYETKEISTLRPIELIPNIEVYGQNEIYEIAQDSSRLRKLLGRFIGNTEDEANKKREEIHNKLKENSIKLIRARDAVADVEDSVSRLPGLNERLGVFKDLKLDDKLKTVPLIEIERNLLKRIDEEGRNLADAFSTVTDNLPETVFLSEAAIANLPHADIFREMRTSIENLKKNTQETITAWTNLYTRYTEQLSKQKGIAAERIAAHEEEFEKAFKDIPDYQGKTGKQIGIEYKTLVQKIEEIRPQEKVLENKKAVVAELEKERKGLLEELGANKSETASALQRLVRKLNKAVVGKLHIEAKSESDRGVVIDHLLSCNMLGVGEARLKWIMDAEEFSTIGLAEIIRSGDKRLFAEKKWPVTPTVIDALMSIPFEKILELEEIDVDDTISIELNVSHTETEEYRSLERLSTGQQCTAILHLLLLDNKDPLILDQPEDNLDNAFIADHIVEELRRGKLERQFIFATHNANIPVFGDAEWIGVLQSDEKQATLPIERQGAIDALVVRDLAANILEGGKTAFMQRKEKYGI